MEKIFDHPLAFIVLLVGLTILGVVLARNAPTASVQGPSNVQVTP